MARLGDAKTVVQYGIETPTSRSIVLMTESYEEAAQLLDLLGNARVIARTVRYGPWRRTDEPRQPSTPPDVVAAGLAEHLGGIDERVDPSGPLAFAPRST